MNWKFFTGAVILTGFAMLKAGAPLETVVAGVGLAALINVAKRRSSTTATEKGKVQR
jgi:hypothetical protein